MEHVRNHKRINITLPQNTLSILNKVTEKGGRSEFINQAIRQRIGLESRRNIERLMKERAIVRAKDDLRIAEEWFPIEVDVDYE